MAQETCQYCGDAMAIETEDGWRCIGCGRECDDDDDG
jgi:tRNA(Ile2) C34 agmatinyltransferase TiaS